MRVASKHTWDYDGKLIWKRDGEQYPFLVFRLTTKEALYQVQTTSEAQDHIAWWCCDCKILALLCMDNIETQQ